MYKIFSIVLLMAISSAVIGQEKHFVPKPLQVPGTDGSTGLPSISPIPNKIDVEKMKELMRSNAVVVGDLAPDNMPCLVPNQANIAAIPNGFSPRKGLTYMPNSMPLSKKFAPR